MAQDLFDHRSDVVVLQAIEDVAPLSVAGGEVQVAQDDTYRIATAAQIAAYLAGGAIPVFALPASGAGLSGARATTIGDADAVWVTQARGLKALTLAILRAFITA